MFFALLALVAPLAAAMTITTGDNAKYLSVHTEVLWRGVGQGDHLVLYRAHRYWDDFGGDGYAGPITYTGYKDGEPIKYCLDGTAAPANGVKPHLWECYDGLAAQQWEVQGQLIRLAGTDFCLDRTGGTTEGNVEMQIWLCSDSPNQLWNVPGEMGKMTELAAEGEPQ